MAKWLQREPLSVEDWKKEMKILGESWPKHSHGNSFCLCLTDGHVSHLRPPRGVKSDDLV